MVDGLDAVELDVGVEARLDWNRSGNRRGYAGLLLVL